MEIDSGVVASRTASAEVIPCSNGELHTQLVQFQQQTHIQPRQLCWKFVMLGCYVSALEYSSAT